MDKVEQALRLLSMLRGKEITVKEAIEVIELVTSVPELVKETLLKAEERGLIKREKNRLIISDAIEFNAKIRKVKCESNCRRCGRKITNCYFINEVGPFGSECVRKPGLI